MEWQVQNEKLTKDFSFHSFLEAIDFVHKVAQLAEKQNHHPDFFIHDYKEVRITLFTHSQNKITELDYTLAKQIDLLN